LGCTPKIQSINLKLSLVILIVRIVEILVTEEIIPVKRSSKILNELLSISKKFPSSKFMKINF